MLSRFSCARLFETRWTVVAHQAPLSMEFSRQKYRSGWLCCPPGDLPDQGSNPHLLHLLHWQAGSLPLAPPGKPNRLSICKQTAHNAAETLHSKSLLVNQLFKNKNRGVGLCGRWEAASRGIRHMYA